MSRPKSQPVTAGPDGATPTGAMTLSGVVKTTKGHAVATVTIAPDGSHAVKLGVSHAFKEFAAREHRGLSQTQTVRA